MSRATPATLTLLACYVLVFFRFDLQNPTDAALIRAGACLSGRVADGEVWRLLSAQIVHIGFVHLLFNGYFLWQVGPLLEQILGTTRFVILYIVAGLFGNVATCLFYDPSILSAGGSTSLFGFLGALIAFQFRAGRSIRDFFENPAARSLLGLVAVNVVIGFLVPYISQTGHLGGLVGGILVTSLAFKLPEAGGPPRSRPLRERIAFVAFTLAVTALAIRPVHRAWFTAQQLYNEPNEERTTELRAALEARGVSEASTRFVWFAGRARRNTRDPLTSIETRTLIETYDGNELYERVGMNYDKLLRVESLLQDLSRGKSDAILRLPAKPWVREERN